MLRHDHGILQWDVLPSPFLHPIPRPLQQFSIAPSQNFGISGRPPRIKKALPCYCMGLVPAASLQPPPPPPASKVPPRALQTTRFTHHLFGSGRVSGAVGAASEAGGDVLHVVFSAHWVKDVLRAVAPARRLNLPRGTQCTAKKEAARGGKNVKKLRNRTEGRKIPLTS